MLDPFPFGGGITTCDALWMGVPVVICPGETFASRHSLSHLASAGLTETIATTTDAYVELAVSLAGDLPRLAALRAGLRDRVRSSPLCDGERFAANLMPVLRDLWQAWCLRRCLPRRTRPGPRDQGSRGRKYGLDGTLADYIAAQTPSRPASDHRPKARVGFLG